MCRILACCYGNSEKLFRCCSGSDRQPGHCDPAAGADHQGPEDQERGAGEAVPAGSRAPEQRGASSCAVCLAAPGPGGERGRRPRLAQAKSIQTSPVEEAGPPTLPPAATLAAGTSGPVLLPDGVPEADSAAGGAGPGPAAVLPAFSSASLGLWPRTVCLVTPGHGPSTPPPLPLPCTVSSSPTSGVGTSAPSPPPAGAPPSMRSLLMLPPPTPPLPAQPGLAPW